MRRAIDALSEPRSFLLFIFAMVAALEYADYVKAQAQADLIGRMMDNLAAERAIRLEGEREATMAMIGLVAGRPGFDGEDAP